MAKNDGGPAFPFALIDAQKCKEDHFPGLSLRAYFAGQALGSLIQIASASPESREALRQLREEDNKNSAEIIAAGACDYADALIAELNKEE